MGEFVDEESDAFREWWGNSGECKERFEAWRAWSAAVARVTLRDVSTEDLRQELERRK